MSGLSRDEISRIIQDNGLFHGTMALGVVMDANHLERFAALVAAAEREVCAQICEKYYTYYGYQYMADAIRARGQS